MASEVLMSGCRKTIYDAAILTVEADTSGFTGGDGGFSVVRFKEEAGGGFTFSASPDGKEVQLRTVGDGELRCLIEGLKFAVQSLEACIHIEANRVGKADE